MGRSLLSATVIFPFISSYTSSFVSPPPLYYFFQCQKKSYKVYMNTTYKDTGPFLGQGKEGMVKAQKLKQALAVGWPRGGE